MSDVKEVTTCMETYECEYNGEQLKLTREGAFGELIDYTQLYSAELRQSRGEYIEGWRVFRETNNGQLEFVGLFTTDKQAVRYVKVDTVYRLSAKESADSIKQQIMQLCIEEIQKSRNTACYDGYDASYEGGKIGAYKEVISALKDM